MGPRAVRAEPSLPPKQRKKLDSWIRRLKEDPFAGEQVPKNRIPAALSTRSGIPTPLTNAWRFELPLAFRGIYTVQGNPATGVVVLILEILSHKDYDRLFGDR